MAVSMADITKLRKMTGAGMQLSPNTKTPLHSEYFFVLGES